jgi:hypothetical protein
MTTTPAYCYRRRRVVASADAAMSTRRWREVNVVDILLWAPFRPISSMETEKIGFGVGSR